MHEMSIAEGILDVALDTLRQHDASVIHSVQLDLDLGQEEIIQREVMWI